MGMYKAVIVGLSGTWAARPPEPEGLPVYSAMPRSHASAYPITEAIYVHENGGDLVSPAREARKTLELMRMLKSHELGNARVDFPLL